MMNQTFLNQQQKQLKLQFKKYLNNLRLQQKHSMTIIKRTPWVSPKALIDVQPNLSIENAKAEKAYGKN